MAIPANCTLYCLPILHALHAVYSSPLSVNRPERCSCSDARHEVWYLLC